MICNPKRSFVIAILALMLPLTALAAENPHPYVDSIHALINAADALDQPYEELDKKHGQALSSPVGSANEKIKMSEFLQLVTTRLIEQQNRLNALSSTLLIAGWVTPAQVKNAKAGVVQTCRHLQLIGPAANHNKEAFPGLWKQVAQKEYPQLSKELISAATALEQSYSVAAKACGQFGG